MEVAFVQELPTVFNILKTNPEAIVDDTAIERLLNWLEEICKKYKTQEFINVCLTFLQSKELWDHKVTSSFGLRLLGYLGDYYQQNDHIILEFIQNDFHLDTIMNQPQFENASVQYSYYKCLQSLIKNEIWIDYIKRFMWPVLLDTFIKGTLFVKKASILFLATYFCTIGEHEADVELMKRVTNQIDGRYPNSETLMTLSHVSCIGKSIIEIFKKDRKIGLKVLKQYQYLQLVLCMLRSNHEKLGNLDENNDVIKTLIEIFKAVNKFDGISKINWYTFIGLDKNELLEELLGFFITHHESTLQLESSKNYIRICHSLLQPQKENENTNHLWNSQLLYRIMYQVIPKEVLNKDLPKLEELQRNQPYLEHPNKRWKQLLVEVITVLSSIDTSQILHSVGGIETILFGKFVRYLHHVMLASSGAILSDVIDHRIYDAINDKKMAVLCYQFFKNLNFDSFHENLLTDHSHFLMKLFNLSTDSSQIICNNVDLLTKFINHTEIHLDYLLQVNYDDTIRKSFVEALNMKLWDVSWEVKDSILTCLTKLIDASKRGFNKHTELLEGNRFWCKILPLLNDSESFVRAKTATLLGHIYVVENLWNIFCEENDYTKLKFWTDFELIFLDDTRLDDLFTRRSILEMIIFVITKNKLYLYNEATKSSSSIANVEDTYESCGITASNEEISKIYEILKNGFSDFDWEVRKLIITIWIETLEQFLNHIKCSREIFVSKGMLEEKVDKRNNERDHFENFINYLFSTGFLSSILVAMIDDCELAVNLEGIKFFNLIRLNMKKPMFYNTLESSEEKKDTVEISESGLINSGYITTRDELLECIKTNPVTDKYGLYEMVTKINFELLSHQSNGLDESVKMNPLSFVHDIIASCKQSEENLLDCY